MLLVGEVLEKGRIKRRPKRRANRADPRFGEALVVKHLYNLYVRQECTTVIHPHQSLPGFNQTPPLKAKFNLN